MVLNGSQWFSGKQVETDSGNYSFHFAGLMD